MVEQVLHPRNLQRALQQVILNKGSAGVDGIKASQLAQHFQLHKAVIIEDIRENKYLPQPILGVEIPKEMVKHDF